MDSSTGERDAIKPSIGKIEEFGRRARARSEQQRQNRKAIKVIEGSSLIAEQERKETKSRAFSSNINSGIERKRQKRRSKTHQSFSTKVARKTDKLLWTPDISEIPIPSKDNQSPYVLLHGLPIGSTFETVRKFFTGLIPERILVVLTNRAYVSKLDSSSYDDLRSLGLDDLVYSNRDVRVLVKFDSVAAAGLAADRSGETVSSKHISCYTFKDSNREEGEKTQRGDADHLQDSFSIGVTNVSKEMAFSLSKLSFDAFPGVPFHDCLSDVESKLHPKVREILWTSAEKACQVSVDGQIKNANILIQAVGKGDSGTDTTKLFAFAEYKKHSIHYNHLLRMHEDLMSSILSEQSDSEACNSMDPLQRLTAHACMVIDHEMDRIDSLLYQYRASRFL